MNHDTEHMSDEELKEVRHVMAFCRCDRTTAKTILEASKLNGSFRGITQMAHEHNKSKEINHGW